MLRIAALFVFGLVVAPGAFAQGLGTLIRPETALEKRGAALLDQSDFAAAKGAFTEALAVDRTFAAVLGMALAEFHLGVDSDAERLLLEALSLDPGSAEPLRYLGLLKERIGRDRTERLGAEVGASDLSQAAEYYLKAARLATDPFDVYCWRADCLATLGRNDDAATAILAALERRPDDAGVLERACALLKAAERWTELEAVALRFGQRSPGLAADAFRLAAAARLRPAEAETLFDAITAVDHGRDRFEPVEAVFQAWNTPGGRDRLIALLERAAKRSPGAAPAHYYLGLAYSFAGRFLAAAKSYETYLTIVPDDAVVLARRIQTLRLGGRSDEAEVLLRAAFGRGITGPAMLEVGQWQVFEHVTANRFAEALALQRVMRDAVREPTIERGYAVLLKENGDLEGALAIYRTLADEWADLDPDVRAVYINEMGLCLKGLGRKGDAEAAYRRAMTVSVRALDAPENLGVLLFDLGRHEEARPHLEAVVDADPSRERARYYLRRIGKPAKD